MRQKLRCFILCLLISSFAFAQSFRNEWIDYSRSYYKFKVFGFGTDAAGSPAQKGIVRIPYASLASAGLSATAAEHFQLWRDGQEVPVYVSKITGALGAEDYIEFWGEINNGKLDKDLYRDANFQLSDRWSLQTDTAAYFLTINTTGTNKRFTSVSNNTANNTLPATSYFMHTVGRHYRTGAISNGFAASAGENLYSSSYDKGEGWVSRAVRPVACGSSGNLPQGFYNLNPYLGGPDLMVRLHAVGNQQNSRSVRLNMNGESISVFQMDYINHEKLEESLPVSKISSGNAEFQVVNLSPSSCDEMRVSMIELTYPRIFNMGGASVFNFSLSASNDGHYLTIANFNHGGVSPVLYDISNGKKYVGDISNPDTLKILLDPSAIDYNLVLTTQAGTYYKNISSVEQRNFIDFSSAANQGDYLIISNPIVYGSGSSDYVEQYRSYRSSVTGGGYNAKVIDINELVDQFAWGIKKHPLSIKNFLRFARSNFSIAPKYAFIIGKGVTYNEYRANESNSLIEKLNLVPTWGYPASDNMLASEDENAIPATPIGRLSAVTAQEVGDYLTKVKQYDSTQKSTAFTLEDKGWMKNVLQIAGANDLGLGSQLDGYLDNYKTMISDTSFGANVINFSKNANPAGYTDAVNSFKNIYEKGSSLITYFGHSSSTSLDFNLDNPGAYDNEGKYPVFIVNGCNAGNNYTFETNRFNNKSTISEKFVLTPGHGAIGYLASTNYGVVNYLDTYTREFYKAISRTKYNQSMGVIMKEAITKALASTGTLDFYSRVHSEQYAYQGDPAIILNSAALPDYVVEEPQIQIIPSYVSVADTSFVVKVKVNNIGKAAGDSVGFKLNRELPDGRIITVSTKQIAPLKNVDSVFVEVPIVGNRDGGTNKLTVILDYNNDKPELSENNNVATKILVISPDDIRPVYPYNYAVINQPAQILEASTVNPLSRLQEYVMELDTTELFNSSYKVIKTKISTGGVIEFDPAVTFEDGKTYYWRVALAQNAGSHWNGFSFTYKNVAEEGSQQGHLYQNLHSSVSKLSVDSVNSKYSFLNKTQNLFLTHSIYPTSGTEDTHFSISVNGSTVIKSACLGSSVIFNVFDSLTFVPWLNTSQPFGAAASCGSGREYNFEYSYRTSASRKNAMDFLNSIPKGSYVAVRLILDQPYNIFAADWAADTATYGSGNSLYHKLKNHGFTAIDSFNSPRTWAFVFRKDDTTFTPAYEISNGLYDRINLSVNPVTRNVTGEITSPKFGRAKNWKNVTWSGYSEEVGNDKPVVDVIGVDANNRDSVLYSLSQSQQLFPINNVDAITYPYIKLRLNNKDSITATPYQLTSWSITYDPVAEGAIAPNLYFNMPDTIGSPIDGTIVSADSLPIGVAFKNVSVVDMDSIAVKIVLHDTLGNAIKFPVSKQRPLAAGDTMHIDVKLDVRTLRGLYNVYLQVNPADQQPEQFSFNNFLYKYVYINRASVLPASLLNFNANLVGNDVQTSWSVSNEADAAQYLLQHSTNGMSFITIGKQVVSTTGAGNATYHFTHANAPNGKNFYRLQILGKDGSFKYSPVKLVTVGSFNVVHVFPNPVKDQLNISVTRRDGKTSVVQLINPAGQQLWQRKVAGTIQIEMAKYANGIYLLQVDDGTSKKTYKINKQ